MYRFDAWGDRILTAIENQGHLLRSVSRSVEDGFARRQQQAVRPDRLPVHGQEDENGDDDGENDLETLSREDTPWTPIASAEQILDWAVFPSERPPISLPPSAYEVKLNLFAPGKPPYPAKLFALFRR